MDASTDNRCLDLFSELLSVPSPPGREERVREIIGKRIRASGYAPETDAAGNMTVRLQGTDRCRPGAAANSAGKMVLAAHMDEIGMVVTRVNDDGTLSVDRNGGLYPAKIGEAPLEVVGDAGLVTGVLSMGSMHRPDAADRSFAWADVRVITGLSPEQLRERGVRVGSSAVPARFLCGPVVFGDEEDPLVAAWTFDDRMGVVALLLLLDDLRAGCTQPRRDTLICFTVHEEGGCHGAKVLAQRERPEVFVAVDGCPIPSDGRLSLDGRPGIWSKDSVTNFDQPLIQTFFRAALAAGTELQPVVYASAASDASYVYSVGGAERVATVGHVRENSHGYEVARLSVFEHVVATLGKFVEVFE